MIPNSGNLPGKTLRGSVFLFFSLVFLLAAGDLNHFHRPVSLQNAEITGQSAAVSISIDYSDPESYQQIISHPGAVSLAVHFSDLMLADGDQILITGADGSSLRYPGDPHPEHPGPGFWSISVPGDTALVSLVKNSAETSNSYFVTIDQYIFGFNAAVESGFQTETLIGSDDKQDAVCYEGSDPEAYASSQAVVKLSRTYLFDTGTGGESYWVTSVCTGWRVRAQDGPYGYILTNEHCIADQTELDETVVIFGYENQTCGGNDPGTTITADYTITHFEEASADYDWSVFKLYLTPEMAAYGYIDVDPRAPVLHETIYLPQHPGGEPKMLGLEDSQNLDDGLCRIDDPLYAASYYDPDREAGYYCDTAGGSSGSPVIAEENGRAIALHHAWNGVSGDPLNVGIRIDLIWPDIKDYLKPAEVEDKSGPTGILTSLDPITYTWDNEPTADTFTFILNESTNGTVHIGNAMDKASICSGDTCSYTPDFDYYNEDYTWNVRGNGVPGVGPYGDDLPFTIYALPEKPSPGSPTGEVPNTRPTFTWDEIRNTEDYRLYLTNPVSGTLINSWLDTETICSAGTCSYQPDMHLRTGNHSWYVQGRNNAGGSTWTDETKFKVWNTTPPDGALTVTSHTHRELISETRPDLTWNVVERASWYKVYISDNSGKLYNQYHRAADICYSTICTLDWATYSPLFEVSRSITDFPTDIWIHFYAMPVNVAGNGSWTGPVDFRIEAP